MTGMLTLTRRKPKPQALARRPIEQDVVILPPERSIAVPPTPCGCENPSYPEQGICCILTKGHSGAHHWRRSTPLEESNATVDFRGARMGTMMVCNWIMDGEPTKGVRPTL